MPAVSQLRVNHDADSRIHLYQVAFAARATEADSLNVNFTKDIDHGR